MSFSSGIFLFLQKVALCFSITVESLKRFYEPEDIHNPQMILLVGALGLVVNLLGLCLFHEHGHSHGGGGHGHSHGGGKKEGKKEGERGGFFMQYKENKNRLVPKACGNGNEEKRG